MLYTITYDGFNYDNKDCTEVFIDLFFNKYPFNKTCDVLESQSGDIVNGYYQALEASDKRLSISCVEVYIDKEWKNIHEFIN